MTVWSEASGKLTDPAVIAGVIVALIGLGIYRRQLVLNRKVELNREFNTKLDELYETLSSAKTLYDEALNILANIGDKYKNTSALVNTTEAINQRYQEVMKDIENKYEATKKIIQGVESYRARGAEIINELASDPMIARNFTSAASSLNKEHTRIHSALGRANNLLIWINPLPPDMSGGQNTSPQLFHAIRVAINTNIEDLKQFQLYVQDAKKLLYNELVGGAFMFKKYKPAYLEQRSVLTKKGIRDYSVETSRCLRLKRFVRSIWG